MIEEVEYTEKNGKKFYKIRADGVTYRAFSDSVAFKQLKEDEFKVGSSVNLRFKDNKVGDIVYHNLEKIEKFGVGNETAIPVQTPPKAPEKYSLATDTRQIIIVRQNALRHADERAGDHVKIHGTMLPDKDYFAFSELVEEHIWRGLKPKEETK